MKPLTLMLMSPILAMAPIHGVAGADPHSDINVTAQQQTLEKWTQRTGHMLSRNLTYPDIASGPQEGVVAVKFVCSDKGTPAGVTLLRSSGSRQLDNAALKGVARISSLHPLPAGLGPSQKYVATVLFAKDQGSYFRQIRKLETAAQDNNRMFNGRNQTLALGIGLLTEEEALN